MDLHWYVIRTKPLSEHIARANLEDQGLDVFYPKYYDRRRKKVRPLFPCYIFVRMSYADDFRRVSYTRSVANIVRFRNMPQPISEVVIRELQRRTEDESGLVVTFEPGEAIEIIDGPFAGQEAIFRQDTKDMDRVVIMLNICERQIETTIKRADLDKQRP